MSKLGKDADRAKDKIVGEVREAAGKVTGDKKLELKGKIQSTKADIMSKVDEKIEDNKERFTEKISDKMDRNKRDIKKHK